MAFDLSARSSGKERKKKKKKTGEAWLLGLILGSRVGGHSCRSLVPCSCLIGWAGRAAVELTDGDSRWGICRRFSSPWTQHFPSCSFVRTCGDSTYDAFLKCVSALRVKFSLLHQAFLTSYWLKLLAYKYKTLAEIANFFRGPTSIWRWHFFPLTPTGVWTHQQCIDTGRLLKCQNSVTPLQYGSPASDNLIPPGWHTRIHKYRSFRAYARVLPWGVIVHRHVL